MTEIKQKLFDYCHAFLDKRINSAREAIQMAQASANEETKSSAGDKYETGRAMAQLEIEKNAFQLEEALKEKKLLNSINISLRLDTAQNGALVTTNQGNFFIAVSVGKATVDGKDFAIVSSNSPVGKLFIGKKIGETFTFGQRSFTIASIE